MFDQLNIFFHQIFQAIRTYLPFVHRPQNFRKIGNLRASGKKPLNSQNKYHTNKAEKEYLEFQIYSKFTATRYYCSQRYYLDFFSCKTKINFKN